MKKPKVGDVYICSSYDGTRNELGARNNIEFSLYWVMQIIQIINFEKNKYFVCHKLHPDKLEKPEGSQLYLFDEEGDQIDSIENNFAFFISHKSRRKKIYQLER